VPCAVTVHSVSLRTVAARGLPVHADCSYIHRIVLDMHVLAVDGHKRVSTGAALSEGVTVAYKTVHNPGAHFSVNARLRPVRPIRRDLARRRSAVVLIRAAADRPTADGNGSVSGYVIRTLRR